MKQEERRSTRKKETDNSWRKEDLQKSQSFLKMVEKVIGPADSIVTESNHKVLPSPMYGSGTGAVFLDDRKIGIFAETRC